MYYTVYLITNKKNGRWYIGKHQTKDLDDGYMGSGKLIIAAIEKYGLEQFEKKILYVFETEEEMNDKEKELVTEEFCKSDVSYNLCPGGHGGFGYIRSHPKFKEWQLKAATKSGEIAKKKMGIREFKFWSMVVYWWGYFKKMWTFTQKIKGKI